MRSRRVDPNRLRAALAAQLERLGDDPARAEQADPSSLLSLSVTAVLQGVSRIGPVEPDPALLRLVVRQLLDLLTRRAPGKAVEVRIPPYAAVQCIPGPRHTRGTPPNVVETDAVSWLRLATGELSWTDAIAAGRLTASGERADISGYLPLLPQSGAASG